MVNGREKFRTETNLIVEEQGLNALVTYFDIGSLLYKPIILHAGMSNLSYLVNTAKGNYICKIFPHENYNKLQNDMVIHSQLKVGGINSPQYLFGPDGKYVFDNNLFMAVVYSSIPGVNTPTIDGEYCHSMGKTLSFFHSYVNKLTFINSGLLNPNWVIKELSHITSSLSTPLISALLKAYMVGKTLDRDNLPIGIVHGDFHEGNVLVDENQHDRIQGILDFEHTESNVLIFDLARTALGICRDDNGEAINPTLFDSLLRGYSSVRKLTNPETENMAKAITYVAGVGGLWLIFHGINPLPLASQFLSRAESIIANDNFKNILERCSLSR